MCGHMKILPNSGHVIPGGSFSKMVELGTDSALNGAAWTPAQGRSSAASPPPFVSLALSSARSPLPPDSPHPTPYPLAG